MLSNRPPLSNRPDLMNLSFSGCGFLCVYHTGVAAAIKEYAPQLTQNRISGASAGSIIAAGLLTGVCISQATTTILNVVSNARKRTLGPMDPKFSLMEIVRYEVEKTLPPDAYKTCTGRLFISLTRWSDRENVIVSEYCSNEDLVDAIMCSCFIPIYCGFYPPKYRGVQYIDGGVSNNQPTYDKHTVTVSPFSGESDICPPDWDSASFFGMYFSQTSIRFTTRNMFRLMACLLPRSNEDCAKMCLQGFEDALRFLSKNGLAPCIRCLAIQTNAVGAVCRLSEGEQGQSSTSSGQTQIPIPVRRRKRTQSQRSLVDSDIETCCESEHVYNAGISSVVPPLMMKPFNEAIAAEKSMFTYLLSFRVMKLARTAFGLSVLPIDVMLLLAKNIMTWLSAVAAPPWIVHKMQQLSQFILSEIDSQKSRYTKFSCHMSVMEFDTIGNQRTEEKEEPIELSEDAKRELELIREVEKKRKAPMSAALPRKESLPSQKRVSVSSRRLTADDLSVLKAASPSGSGTRTPTGSAQIAKEWTYLDDVDSLHHVINYSQQHDAMYQFHYYDDNNKRKSFELFNIADPTKRHTCHSSIDTPRCVTTVLEEGEQPESLRDSIRRVGPPPPSHQSMPLHSHSMPVPLRQTSLKSTTTSPEPIFDLPSSGASPPDVDEVDSGLSGMDIQPRSSLSSQASHKWDRQLPAGITASTTGRRDACCSPVRDLSSSPSVRSLPQASSTASSASTSGTLLSSSSTQGGRKSHVQRRHTMATSLPFSRKHSVPIPSSSATSKQSSRGLPSLISSDSEADGGEKLFVPRRVRRSSNDYDGGQEESDDDEQRDREAKGGVETQRRKDTKDEGQQVYY